MIKCVFMFDFCGVQIDKGTIIYLSDKYKIKSGSINGAIVRKSIVDQKFYFQLSDKFVLPNKKKSFNPFLSKNTKIMIIEVTPAQNCWYLVDIDLFEEQILLSCDFTITTEDQLLHSISLFKKLAGLPESYHISIVDENRAMLAILTPKCKLLASGVHHPNDVNEIKKRIIKNYEKTN